MVAARSSSQPLTQNAPLTNQWTHTPSNFILIWLAISLPLVTWDLIYTLFRPHTMEGGWMHDPIYKPYALYAKIDYMYGWKALTEGNGFTSAQGFMNLVETVMYFYYVYMLYKYGKQSRVLTGRPAAQAVLVVFSASVMTLSKTVLYGLNEYFSGFQNIGHNNISDLIFLWIIPNGSWIVIPTYMTYVFGTEIVEGLSGVASKKQV